MKHINPEIRAWKMRAIKKEWYDILVSISWDIICKCTERPPKEINIDDIVTLYISGIGRLDNCFSPIVISKIPFNMVLGYGAIFNVWMIREEKIRKQVNVPKINNNVSIAFWIDFISVVLKFWLSFLFSV